MNRFKYRILFSKTEAMRFTGHLDLFRVWERLLRRAQVPLGYSTGFHPHPKIQIGAALPLGVTGDNELVDIETSEGCDANALARQIAEAVPPGVSDIRVNALPADSPGLEKLVVAGDYSAKLLDGAWPEDLPQRIEHLMVNATLLRERRGKSYDLRPRILSLALDGNQLQMRLRLEPDATGRPDEMLAALGMESLPVLVRRERLVLRESEGKMIGSDDLG
ncbi:MAG TPA: TIGR03936 family radical SAM-associated protein [Anaerolineales bacterium]